METILSKFRDYIALYRKVEENVVRLTTKHFPEVEVERMHTNERGSFEKNYLSIFFLMMYRKIGLNKDKIIFYGTINYLVRGIVTCTDNLLDSEKKFLLHVKNIGSNAPMSQSIFLLVLFQAVLENYLDDKVNEKFITVEEKTKI